MDSSGIRVAPTVVMRPGLGIGPALGVLLAACSSGTLVPDAGGPDGGGATQDAGKCIGDLATVGAGCPAMFDGTEANLPACRGISDISARQRQSVWHCQNLIILSDSDGFVVGICYYDATSHALVGAQRGTDTPGFCGQTSLLIEAGRTNQMCLENAPTTERPCNAPDGGSSSG